jgi:ribosomal protein S27AE
MPLRQKVFIVNAGTFVGCFLAMWLAANLETPAPGFVWLALSGIARASTRCPTCGKSVFIVERRRTIGISLGYARLAAERVCSRCGGMLLDYPSKT